MGGSGEWKLAGLGTISADGKSVVSDPGVGIPRFCGVCGLLSQSCPPPPKPPQPPKSCPVARTDDPIDYYTGQDLPTSAGLSCGGLVPLDTGMSFNPVDALGGRAGAFGSFGLGWTLDYDIVLLPFEGPQKRLVLPGGRLIDFIDDGSGNYRNSDSRAADGAVMRRTAGSASDWEVLYKDGRLWKFQPFPGIDGVIRGGAPLYATELIDAAGATLSISRQRNGRLLAAGTQERSITATLGANGFISEIRDSQGRSTCYGYNAENYLETVTDAMGGVTRYGYVSDTPVPREPTPIGDAGSGPLPPPRDICGRPVDSFLSDARRIKTIHYPGRPNPTENFYGAGNRVLRQVAYDGVETRMSYQVTGACVGRQMAGGPVQACSGASCPTTESWEAYQAGWRFYGGQVVQTTVTRADGSTDTVRYGAKGQMLERRDGNAQATLYQRDADDRITRSTDPLGRTLRKSYDARGNVTRTIDALGRITDITYDGRWNKPSSLTRYEADGTPNTWLLGYSGSTGRLIRSTDPLGNNTLYGYTERGQLSTVTDALNHRTELNYDAAGDLIQAIDALGNDLALGYDRAGRPTSSTDPLGYSRGTQYNALDQPTQLTDPTGGTTQYAYDSANRLTSVTNALNKLAERYGYDSGDRLTTRTDALGRSDAMSYDAMGRLATYTDRKGQTIRLAYDAESRLTSAQRTDGTMTMSYDIVGRLTRVEDTGSTLEYEYDAADRLIRETQTTQAGRNVIGYEYDTLDRRTRRTVNGADPTTYGYDRAGRLTSIGYQGQTTRYEYDAANRLTVKTLPNGITQTMSYDAANRLTGIVYANASTTLEAVTYTYDPNGRRISKTSNSNSTAQETPFTATYDDADRMTAITLRGTGANNTDEACTLAYDANGNLATKSCGTNSSAYRWDSQDRLTGITAAGISASFQYDALGRRTTRTVNGATTTYVYDGPQAIAETKGGVNATILTGLQIDEVIARYANGANRTMLTDALGTVLAESRDDRTVATRREFTPYGQSIQTGETSANDAKYTAREDDQTGLYFYRARYYDPQLKRFVSEDPIGLGGGISRYAYVGGGR